MSINDFYDVTEAMDVAYSWERAAYDNQKDQAPARKSRR
jgi:hypothetical protein